MSAITSILDSNSLSISSSPLFYLWLSLADSASVLFDGLRATAALTCGAAGARPIAVLTSFDPFYLNFWLLERFVDQTCVLCLFVLCQGVMFLG